MSREKPAFRDNMEMLLEANDRKNMIRVSKAAQILGVKKQYLLEAEGLTKVRIGQSWMMSVPTLARWLS